LLEQLDAAVADAGVFQRQLGEGGGERQPLQQPVAGEKRVGNVAGNAACLAINY